MKVSAINFFRDNDNEYGINVIYIIYINDIYKRHYVINDDITIIIII